MVGNRTDTDGRAAPAAKPGTAWLQDSVRPVGIGVFLPDAALGQVRRAVIQLRVVDQRPGQVLRFLAGGGHGHLVGGEELPMAWLGAVTTGVPDAEISKMRRAHMLGESTTELTLRKTL